MSILQLVRDFKDKKGYAQALDCLRWRACKISAVIHRFKHIDTNTKVKVIFALSAPVDANFLKHLRKYALVIVDTKKRITFYKANDGSLELSGDHSRSAKNKTAQLESKQSLRSMINAYFKNKKDCNAVPKNEEEKEMGIFIEFITEKCETADTPLCITQLTKEFNNQFGISRSFNCIYTRIRKYCHEIQKAEFLDTLTKVKQLFGLSAELDLDYLKKLREDADVDVDDLNRITKYTSKNGLLTLHRNYSRSAKRKLSWIVRRKNRITVKNYCNSGDEDEESEKETGYSEDDSDEYFSEEFESEFDSDDENNPLDEAGDLVEPSNRTDEFGNETLIRNRSPTEMSINDNLNFDPPTERSHRSEEIEMKQDEQNEAEITVNARMKTRSGRLSKRRHSDSEFTYNLANRASSRATMNTNSASVKPAKQKKIASEQEQPSSKSKRRSSKDSSFPAFSTESGENMGNQDAAEADGNPNDYHPPRIQEMDDYDYNPREDNIPESSSINISPQESESPAAEENNSNIDTEDRSDAVAPEPISEKECHSLQNNTNSTSQTSGKEVNSQEVPIKVENGEPIIVEDHPEDVKPEIAHNFKIKFFEAMKSLILFLDTASLSDLKSKIYQKIRKMKGSKEVLQNNELIPALELLIARMTNHSVIDISEGVKSISLVQFFCYLKASILNSRMIGVEGLMNNISGFIEKSQNKRIPMEKVANALRATLDIDSF